VATLRELSWDPADEVVPDLAFRILEQLRFRFDRDLEPDLIKRFTRDACVITYHPERAAAPVGAVGTETFLADPIVVAVNVDLAAVRTAMGQFGPGVFVIDLNCDVVVDVTGLPASSCWTGLTRVHAPRPGGIMRTQLRIRG
jgi:hypothetical protein